MLPERVVSMEMGNDSVSPSTLAPGCVADTSLHGDFNSCCLHWEKSDFEVFLFHCSI